MTTAPDSTEHLRVQVPRLHVLNEMPQLMPHHVLGPECAVPRVARCEGVPIVADADNSVAVVN